MVLGTAPRTQTDLALGTRIRELRQRRGMSVGEVATLAAVSKSLVSQIERGVASPSIDTVRKIASALELPVFSLFLEDADSDLVVRKRNRRIVRYPESEVTREVLSPSLHSRLALLWVTYPPGEAGRLEPVHHTGEECVVVVRGTLEITLGEQVIQLQCGDSMGFDSELPHIFRNPGSEPAEVVVAISPPSI
jgi:transcriptional regulator with XRE-family HTH domain